MKEWRGEEILELDFVLEDVECVYSVWVGENGWNLELLMDVNEC